ncbi:FAS1 domain [Macleaya cordata]|uniref:FAS1 domain n=1 Tax=Macleaya cordata TaxID=56857 RepID=A0A200QJQ9_MACCD|nr:FAS1 domain [Macleaya cordata]
MGLNFFILFLLLIVPSSKSTATHVNQTALQAAMADMRSKSYFGFVILLKMLTDTMNSTALGHDITFLMPGDRILSDISISPNRLRDFLLSHSIPKSLTFQDIGHMPDGTLIPTSLPENAIRVSTDRRSRVFINNAQIVAPNLCLSSSIKCHGINGVLPNKRRYRSKGPLPIHRSRARPAPVKRTRWIPATPGV